MNEYLVDLFIDQFVGQISIYIMADDEDQAQAQAIYLLTINKVIESSATLLNKGDNL